MYCRPLVEDGRVYAGLSPLYHINMGKKNWTYFIDKPDFLNYVQDQFIKNNELISAITKKKFNRQQLHNFILKFDPYKDLMDRVSNTYAIYPILLEDMLMIRNYDFKKFKKFIESKYRFVTVSQKNGIKIIEGLVNEKSHNIVMSDILMQACQSLLGYIDSSDKRYILNKKTIGLYETLKIIRESEPKNIDRAKGLGALTAKELAIATFDIKNRKLLRYTATDINKEIEEMRRLNDDKFELIKDIDISQYEF